MKSYTLINDMPFSVANNSHMDDQIHITANTLHGTWKLVEFKIADEGGQVKDWGPSPNGILIYDKTGHMSVSINSSAYKNIAKEDLNKHSLFYAGTYKISGPNEISHFVLNASNPNRIGGIQIRKAEITHQKYLRLTAKGDYGQAYLLWKKI